MESSVCLFLKSVILFSGVGNSHQEVASYKWEDTMKSITQVYLQQIRLKKYK